jgi:hypothetical protein
MMKLNATLVSKGELRAGKFSALLQESTCVKVKVKVKEGALSPHQVCGMVDSYNNPDAAQRARAT